MTSGQIVAVALAAAGALLLWWILRRRPWAGARTRYPIVLCHGLLGFDKIRVGPFEREYFHGIAGHLRARGVEVHTPTVPKAASIAERAAALADCIRALPAGRVNLVAHSMGGLDARYAIAHLGIADRVASLTTVGTPHRGTPVADVASRLGEGLGLRPILGKLGIAAFFELTTEHLADFNREVRDARRVRYASVVGVAPPGAPHLPALLKPTYAYLQQKAGDNDGLVPAASQRWGKVLGEVEANHWEQIGWSGPFEATALYEQVATQLRRWGL